MKLRKQLHLCTLEGTKYLGIYLIKEVQYLYTEKCKTLLKESKEMQLSLCKCHLYLQRDFLQGKPQTEMFTCRVKR